MSNYKIDWFNPNAGAAYVTLAGYGITFNKGATEALGNPERVQIGLDTKRQILLVKPLNGVDDDQEKLGLPYKEREQKNGQTRISSRELMHYLVLKCPDLDLESTIRYPAEWVDDQAMLAV